MNELMGGMRLNRDIINADLATEEEVEAFVEGSQISTRCARILEATC